MTTEVATRPSETQVTVGEAIRASGIDLKDVVIPRLVLMQPISPDVAGGKFQMGQVINLATGEPIAAIDKPLELIPLEIFKTIRVFDMTKKPKKWIRTEPETPANAALPWEDTENGQPISRERNINLFALISSEAETGEALPIVMSFKSTSYNAGKAVATHLFKKAAFRKLPYSQAIQVGVKRDSNDKGTYAVFEVKAGRAATENEIAMGKLWSAVLGELHNKVIEDTGADEPQAPAPVVISGEPGEVESF